MKLPLRPYQEAALNAIDDAKRRGVRRVLVVLPTGCHRAGQRVLLHDGTVRRVEDVQVGDRLMGPDSRPRTVLHLVRGHGPMMEVRPVKGDPWVVNEDHVLTLERTTARRPNPRRNGGRVFPSERGGALVDVTVRDWLNWSRNAQHLHKLKRCAVEFPRRTQPSVDPYLMGLLLGDGGLSRSESVDITTTDEEIVEAVAATIAPLGLRVRREGIRLKLVGRRGPGGNPLVEALRGLGVLPIRCEDRFVPDGYRLGDAAVRWQVLAGLLDADGHAIRGGGFELTSKSQQLALDAAFVARSLGLAAYVARRDMTTNLAAGTYWRVGISGDVNRIPCRIGRKKQHPRQQKKDVTRTGFSVEPTGTNEDYFGFTLTGDGRYLLDDFTVTHNSGKTIVFSELIDRRGGDALVLAHRDELLTQAADKLTTVAPHLRPNIGFVQGARDDVDAPIIMGSVQTLARPRRLSRLRKRVPLVVVDEGHRVLAPSYQAVLDHVDADQVVIVTATPERGGSEDLSDAYDELVFARTLRQMIDEGYLCGLRGIQVDLPDLDLSAVSVTGGDYQADALAQAMRDAHAPEHTAAAIKQYAADRKSIVVFCPNVQLADHTAAVLRDAGIDAASVSAQTDKDERKRILADFGARRLRVVVNCALLIEGWDQPVVDCIVMASPTRSRIVYSQCVGRGTRLHPDKRDCLVLDLANVSGDLELQSLPVLFGEDPKARSRRKTTVIAPADPDGYEDVAFDEFPVAIEEATATEVDLLGDRERLSWIAMGERWVLSAGENEYLALDPDEDDWRVLLLRESGAKILASGLDLSYAQGAAEETLRRRDSMRLATSNADWRSRPASPRQLEVLRRWHITAMPETAGEATDMLTKKVAGILLGRLDRALAERALSAA